MPHTIVMKTTKHILTLALTLFCALGTTYAIDQTYYTSIDGKSGSTLRDALYTLTAKGPQNMTYNGLWTAYKTTDVYPSDSTDKAGKIWDMYSNVLFTAGTNQCGTYSNVGDCYNREHSLPKSWFNESTPAYYDLGHIVPTDGKVNGQRSNYPFGECASGTRLTNGTKKGLGKLGTSTFSGYTSVGTVFEPDDIYKGDFARMYMYMVVRYKPGNSNSVNLAAKGEGTIMFNSTDANFGLTDYSIALLMKWHRQDPVSVKEVMRNNGMEKVQGNRNPFIDYPDLAEYLWGNQKNQSVTLSSLSIATGGSSTPTLYDVILNRNGATEQISTSGTYNLPTDEDAACDGWAFAGWSTSSSVNTTTAPSFTTFVSSATTLYAVYSHTTSSAPHRAKMAESEVATVTFKTASSDGSVDVSSSIKSSLVDTESGISSYSGTKVYAGTVGAKLGSGSASGSITITLSSAAAVKSVVVNAKQFGSDTGTLSVKAGTTTIGSAQSPSSTAGNLTFTATTAVSNTTTITVATSSKRAYISSITVIAETSGGGGSTITYKTTPDCGSEHTITLSNNGSATGGIFEANVSSAYAGATITLYAEPSDGYTFGSWTVAKQGGGSVTVSDNQFTMPDANVTVSATFSELTKYNIRFYNNGAQIGSTQSLYAGDSPEVPADPTACEGYTFVGWWTSTLAANNTTTKTWITDFTVSGAQDYYAVFSHTETSGSGGSASWSQVESLNDITNGTYIIENAGYALPSATTSAAPVKSKDYALTISNKQITSAVTDGMKWSFTMSSGHVATIKNAEGSYLYTVSNNNGLRVGSTSDTWTFAANSSAPDFSMKSKSQSRYCATYSSGSDWRSYTTATASNYADGGKIHLYKYSSGGSSSTTYYTSSPDCSTPQNVTVSFNANGGTGTMAKQTIPYNTATALTANTFTRTGYTFQGWATSANGEKVYNNSASVTLTENTTLYALWTVNSYTITTNASTGGSLSTSPSGNANFGATVTITVTPDGTHTVGSVSVKDASNNDVSVSGTGNERTFTMPASNVTVSATFNQKQQYSINFIVDGETISTQNLYEGATAQKPTDPTACEGYTFVGWWTSTLATNNTTAKTWITDFTVSGAQDYYAVFSHTETSGSGGGSTSITLNAQTDKEFPKNGITLSVTDGALNNGTDYRVYKNQKLTITSTVGDITSIALTYSGASYDGGGWSDSYTPNTATWTSPVANGEQARITKIVITIDGGSSSSTTYYTSSPDCVTPCTTLATPAVTATPSNGQITLTWADVKGADHYSVTISKGAGYTTECGNAANIGTITGTTTKTCVITGLTNGLTYTTSVVAHATSETCDSEADEDTAIPTECEDWTDPTLTWSAYNLNTTGTNTATCSISGTTHGTRSFESSNTEVLTVASDGTVTAVVAGTATVTVSWTAADGYCEKSIISDAFEVAGPLTISFDANGGEGTMSDQTVTYKVSTTIKDNSFTRTGYTFQGWALTAAGSKEYNDKQSVAFTNSLTLYAVWQLNSHEVTFTSSVTGATVTVNGQSSSPQTAEYGSTVTLLITPTEHYIVSALTVSGTSGSVDISGTGNTRTFTMPDEAVTVTLTMVAESQYTATFYNGAETFATVSGYADDDIAAPAGIPTSCDDETFTFIGWVATAQASEVTTCPEILTFPQVMTSGGVSYYALFRRSEGGSGGEASVTFKTASADGNTEYTTDSDIKTHIVDSYTGIASFEGSKSYPGKSGVKLGSSKNAGTITLTLSSPITTDKITVEAEKYGTDAGDLKIEVNGNTTFGSALSPASGTLEFTDEEMEISSLTVLTTTARAYVASISLGGGGTNYYTTAPECAACENQVTITKGTAEHGTFQLSKADGSYDNCKNNVSVTVSNITPDYGYYCSSVTATGNHMHVAVSGPDGSGNYTVAYAKGYSITSTINVVFEPLPTYTIRFIDNGSIISTQTIYDGAKAATPTNPTPCDGYTFVGWWTAELDADNTTAETWVADFTASQDQDYYAVYLYTETSGGSSSTPVTKTMSTFTAVSGNVDGDENISYVAAQGGAANDPAINSEEIRIYQNGGTLTVTANNSKKITAVTIGSSMATSVTYAIDGGSASDNQAITANGTLPLSDLNASSILFTCTGTDKYHRLYLNYLSVTYSDGGSSGGTTTTYYTTAPDCEAPIVTVDTMLVAEYGGARVALAHDNTNTVAAMPLMYFNETYFCPNKDKNGNDITAPKADTLTWQVAERTDGYYIMSGGQFLAPTANGFTLTDERFLWSKDGDTRLAYIADAEAFVADQQGDLPGIMPVEVPTTIYQTSSYSQRSGLTIGYFGTICLPHAVALPFTWGVKAYSIKAKKMIDGDLKGIYIVEETEMLNAGQPYLIEAKETQMTMWYPTDAPMVDTSIDTLGLVGNLGTTSVYVPVGCYGISNNQLRRVTAKNTATIGQYKAYIDPTDVPVEGVGISMQSMYKVLYTAEGENVATDTEQLFDPAGINWNEPVYNILGIRVDRNCTGVLIQNGKKFLVTHPRP